MGAQVRLAFCADVHTGNHKSFGGPMVSGLNERCRLVVATLEHAYKVALREECATLVINGDLFDTARPTPQVITEVQRVVKPHTSKLSTVVVEGNHDMESMAPGDHALGPLQPFADVIEKPTRYSISRGSQTIELWAVPFRPGPAAEWLPVVLAEMQAQEAGPWVPRVLALHLGISDLDTPPWLAGAHDSISVLKVAELMQLYKLDAAFAGNWHNPKQWKFDGVGPIIQIGTLCPTGWDNPGLSFGTMSVYDTETFKAKKFNVPGPRFVTSVKEAQDAPRGCKVFLRLTADEAGMEAAQAQLATLKGVVGEVIKDTGETTAALRTAAGVARSSENVDEAVAAFIEQMPLGDESMRPEVLARAKLFLGGAT